MDKNLIKNANSAEDLEKLYVIRYDLEFDKNNVEKHNKESVEKRISELEKEFGISKMKRDFSIQKEDVPEPDDLFEFSLKNSKDKKNDIYFIFGKDVFSEIKENFSMKKKDEKSILKSKAGWGKLLIEISKKTIKANLPPPMTPVLIPEQDLAKTIPESNPEKIFDDREGLKKQIEKEFEEIKKEEIKLGVLKEDRNQIFEELTEKMFRFGNLPKDILNKIEKLNLSMFDENMQKFVRNYYRRLYDQVQITFHGADSYKEQIWEMLWKMGATEDDLKKLDICDKMYFDAMQNMKNYEDIDGPKFENFVRIHKICEETMDQIVESRLIPFVIENQLPQTENVESVIPMILDLLLSKIYIEEINSEDSESILNMNTIELYEFYVKNIPDFNEKYMKNPKSLIGLFHFAISKGRFDLINRFDEMIPLGSASTFEKNFFLKIFDESILRIKKLTKIPEFTAPIKEIEKFLKELGKEKEGLINAKKGSKVTHGYKIIKWILMIFVLIRIFICILEGIQIDVLTPFIGIGVASGVIPLDVITAYLVQQENTITLNQRYVLGAVALYQNDFKELSPLVPNCAKIIKNGAINPDINQFCINELKKNILLPRIDKTEKELKDLQKTVKDKMKDLESICNLTEQIEKIRIMITDAKKEKMSIEQRLIEEYKIYDHEKEQLRKYNKKEITFEQLRGEVEKEQEKRKSQPKLIKEKEDEQENREESIQLLEIEKKRNIDFIELLDEKTLELNKRLVSEQKKQLNDINEIKETSKILMIQSNSSYSIEEKLNYYENLYESNHTPLMSAPFNVDSSLIQEFIEYAEEWSELDKNIKVDTEHIWLKIETITKRENFLQMKAIADPFEYYFTNIIISSSNEFSNKFKDFYEGKTKEQKKLYKNFEIDRLRDIVAFQMYQSYYLTEDDLKTKEWIDIIQRSVKFINDSIQKRSLYFSMLRTLKINAKISKETKLEKLELGLKTIINNSKNIYSEIRINLKSQKKLLRELENDRNLLKLCEDITITNNAIFQRKDITNLVTGTNLTDASPYTILTAAFNEISLKPQNYSNIIINGKPFFDHFKIPGMTYQERLDEFIEWMTDLGIVEMNYSPTKILKNLFALLKWIFGFGMMGEQYKNFIILRENISSLFTDILGNSNSFWEPFRQLIFNSIFCVAAFYGKHRIRIRIFRKIGSILGILATDNKEIRKKKLKELRDKLSQETQFLVDKLKGDEEYHEQLLIDLEDENLMILNQAKDDYLKKKDTGMITIIESIEETVKKISIIKKNEKGWKGIVNLFFEFQEDFLFSNWKFWPTNSKLIPIPLIIQTLTVFSIQFHLWFMLGRTIGYPIIQYIHSIATGDTPNLEQQLSNITDWVYLLAKSLTTNVDEQDDYIQIFYKILKTYPYLGTIFTIITVVQTIYRGYQWYVEYFQITPYLSKLVQNTALKGIGFVIQLIYKILKSPIQLGFSIIETSIRQAIPLIFPYKAILELRNPFSSFIVQKNVDFATNLIASDTANIYDKKDREPMNSKIALDTYLELRKDIEIIQIIQKVLTWNVVFKNGSDLNFSEINQLDLEKKEKIQTAKEYIQETGYQNYKKQIELEYRRQSRRLENGKLETLGYFAIFTEINNINFKLQGLDIYERGRQNSYLYKTDASSAANIPMATKFYFDLEKELKIKEEEQKKIMLESKITEVDIMNYKSGNYLNNFVEETKEQNINIPNTILLLAQGEKVPEIYSGLFKMTMKIQNEIMNGLEFGKSFFSKFIEIKSKEEREREYEIIQKLINEKKFLELLEKNDQIFLKVADTMVDILVSYGVKWILQKSTMAFLTWTNRLISENEKHEYWDTDLITLNRKNILAKTLNGINLETESDREEIAKIMIKNFQNIQLSDIQKKTDLYTTLGEQSTFLRDLNEKIRKSNAFYEQQSDFYNLFFPIYDFVISKVINFRDNDWIFTLSLFNSLTKKEKFQKDPVSGLKFLHDVLNK